MSSESSRPASRGRSFAAWKHLPERYIESPGDPSRVASVLRNVRSGWWERAAITNPAPFEDSITLNGESFDLDYYGSLRPD